VGGLRRGDLWPDADAAAFFVAHFDVAEIGGGSTFITGYFEPEIAGSRVRLPGYDVPVYRKPPSWSSRMPRPRRRPGTPRRGRMVDGTIEPSSSARRSKRARWPGAGWRSPGRRMPIDFFFLQIQGSAG
jgi:membrane-bound lytic murein transglycosylase A